MRRYKILITIAILLRLLSLFSGFPPKCDHARCRGLEFSSNEYGLSRSLERARIRSPDDRTKSVPAAPIRSAVQEFVQEWVQICIRISDCQHSQGREFIAVPVMNSREIK